MRDGVKLFTVVYAPKDLSQPYPILMMRTPYSVGPYGIDNYRSVIGPSELAEKEGFIFAYQDVRGRYLSEGKFIDIPAHNPHPKDTDETTDTYDAIDWLVKSVPNNNGRVGIWGISYPGFFAAFSLMNAHPALKAVSPKRRWATWEMATTPITTGRFTSPRISVSTPSSNPAVKSPNVRPARSYHSITAPRISMSFS
jgi:putative CocE/NonD family hydrolase